jgi:fructosamine-3-kinase
MNRQSLRERVAAALDAEVRGIASLDGGEIGDVYRVDLPDRRVVAKTGPTDLTVEARMLDHLGERSPLPVPDVLGAASDLLVIEWLPGETGVTAIAEDHLADLVAGTHAVPPERAAFGFPFETLYGELVQPNPWTDSWAAFYREHRVLHAADAARAADRLPPRLYDRVRALADRFEGLLREPAAPALLHGDLWTENVLCADGAVTGVLDPACYYGHLEVELAYARWTGTVGEPFLERYRERAGLEKNFREREPLYRLYPLLVHAWTFDAERYRESLRAVCTRFE